MAAPASVRVCCEHGSVVVARSPAASRCQADREVWVRSIGMDVHRDFCEVAIAEGGAVRAAGRIQTQPAALALFAQSLVASDEVAI